MIPKSKRSQFKIQQMSFMLLAVVLFFILVALFWLSIQYRNLKKTATQIEEEKSFMISQFLTDSSEFNCADESYCVDTDKLIILANKTIYSEFWPVSYIKVRRIGDEKDVVCNKANYPDCNVYNVYDNKKISSESSIGNFIALCRYEKIEGFTNRICELGKIIIGYDIK